MLNLMTMVVELNFYSGALNSKWLDSKLLRCILQFTGTVVFFPLNLSLLGIGLLQGSKGYCLP